ncbi:MAG: glycosyltransferase family 2 protein [Acidobacteriota bacterium]
MKLSIVILCWNDRKVIGDCLHSIYAGTQMTDFEVIVSVNGSSDGSVEFIRDNYPQVRVILNGANLGFAKGNNVGIRASQGKYVLILNPDTIIHEGALDKWLRFVDHHPEAGAFGCRVLNRDGTYQISARPFPTIWRDLLGALYLRRLAYFSDMFISDTYTGWSGNTEREIDWQSGCCILFRADVLKTLGGFDEQFFYHYEEVDLCKRVWHAGYPILFTPDVTITHLAGQSVNRFPVRFELERCRSRYRYYYKHFGKRGARQYRHIYLARLRLRQVGYGILYALQPTESLKSRLEMYRVSARWNRRLNPIRFIDLGEEPEKISGVALQQP